MSIKRIFIVISAVFAVSAVFADNSSVTSKKYVDDLMSGYQGKLPGSGANTLMIYDDETGIGEKSIETTLGSGATGVPTVGAVKTGLDGKQDTITGTAGYVMTGTGNAGEVGERAIYSANTNYTDALVTAETVNTAVTNAVNSSLIRVDANGNPSDNGTLWEINTSLFALTLLPAGYIQLEYIESDGTQYIDTGFTPNQDTRWTLDVLVPTASTGAFSFGSATSGSFTPGFGVYGGNNSYSYGSIYGGEDFNPASGTFQAGTRYSLDLNKNIFTITTSSVIYTHTHSVQTFTAPATLKLFNLNVSNNRFGKFRMYLSKIWDNGTLVRNLIPAKNNINGKIGMYDVINDVFYPDAAGGNFVAGPAVGN